MKVGPLEKTIRTVNVPNSKQQELLRYLGVAALTPYSGSSKLCVLGSFSQFGAFWQYFQILRSGTGLGQLPTQPVT